MEDYLEIARQRLEAYFKTKESERLFDAIDIIEFQHPVDGCMNDENASGLEDELPNSWQITYISTTTCGFGLKQPSRNISSIDEDVYNAKHQKKSK